MAVANRAKAHRNGAAMVVRTSGERPACVSHLAIGGFLEVLLTRVAPRPLDDDGNVTSLKAVRDGVADALGLKSDRHPRVSWWYAQAKGAPKTYAVRIEVRRITERGP
jgi:hypothetical protein